MGKLIIGVDTDGVLVDMYNYNLVEGKKFFKKTPVNSNGYDVKEMFGCSEKEEIKYGIFKFIKYCKKCPVRENVLSALGVIKSKNIEIHNITARKFVTSNSLAGAYSRKLYEKWLNKNKISFDSIQYCSESNSPLDKYIACRKLGVDIMIDDKPEIALYLAEQGIKVLLFDAPYNQGVNHKNITRVYNWQEIKEYILNLEAEKGLEKQNFRKKNKEEISEMSTEEKNDYFKSYRNFLSKQSLKGNIKLNKIWFKMLYCLGKLPIKLIFKPIIIGGENVPYQDGLILASNHIYNYDQFLISDALGMRYFSGIATKNIEDTFRGRIFKKIGVEFVDRGNAESKKEASENLSVKVSNNVSTLIFPEGTRKDKDEIGKKKLILNFHFGAVAMAQKTGAPIVPFALEYNKGFTLVRIGKPMEVLPSDNLSDANCRLKETITDMVLENKKQSIAHTKVLKKING